MNKYELVKRGKDYDLVETTTGYVVYRGIKKKLSSMKKHMESGGGFNGQTPFFITKGSKTKGLS